MISRCPDCGFDHDNGCGSEIERLKAENQALKESLAAKKVSFDEYADLIQKANAYDHEKSRANGLAEDYEEAQRRIQSLNRDQVLVGQVQSSLKSCQEALAAMTKERDDFKAAYHSQIDAHGVAVKRWALELAESRDEWRRLLKARLE